MAYRVVPMQVFLEHNIKYVSPPLAFARVTSDAQITPDAPPTAEGNVDQSTLLFDVSLTCRTSLGQRPLCRCARDDVSNRRKHGKGSEQRELTTSCNLHCRFAVGVGILRICIVRVRAWVRACVRATCVRAGHPLIEYRTSSQNEFSSREVYTKHSGRTRVGST